MAQKISREPLEYSRHPAMAPKQDPDLIDELSYEHRHIERLWNELRRAHRREAGSGSPADHARLGDADQRELAHQLIEALHRHEEVELDVLYPAAARVMNQEWADDATHDHQLIRDLLDEADGQDPAEEGVFGLLSEALARVVAHIEEEDKILFPIMRREVPRGQLTHPGHPQHRGLMPGHPPELGGASGKAAAATGNGNGNGGNGQKDKKRLRLLRR